MRRLVIAEQSGRYPWSWSYREGGSEIAHGEAESYTVALTQADAAVHAHEAEKRAEA